MFLRNSVHSMTVHYLAIYKAINRQVRAPNKNAYQAHRKKRRLRRARSVTRAAQSHPLDHSLCNVTRGKKAGFMIIAYVRQ